MFYTIYKITNIINNKYYIGKHQTRNLDDGYMGSGKALLASIKKYGIVNFKKEILFIFDTEEEMNAKERELVVISEETYNLCEGGQGGFSYINKNVLNWSLEKNNRISPFKTKEFHEKYREQKLLAGAKGLAIANERYRLGLYNRDTFRGKTHTPETIEHMKSTRKGTGLGENNSQFGTCWVTNGTENKKIKKEDLDTYLKLGYYKGRKIFN